MATVDVTKRQSNQREFSQFDLLPWWSAMGTWKLFMHPCDNSEFHQVRTRRSFNTQLRYEVLPLTALPERGVWTSSQLK